MVIDCKDLLGEYYVGTFAVKSDDCFICEVQILSFVAIQTELY